MIRLSRAGRESAIVIAIRQLEKLGKYKMFTKGEICKKMGIRSTSRIRDMLESMVEDGRLVGATTALDGFDHEVSIYGIAVYEQTPLPPHEIIVNGQTCKMYAGKEVIDHVHV